MDNSIKIKRTSVLKGEASLLPASKSISNRALIINALAGGRAKLHNLSDANDTQLMLRLIRSKDEIIDVEDAGTTMRFLTAYFCITNQSKILTGTGRMKERPIGILVDALRSLGGNIEYLEKDGYPPHRIEGFEGQKTNRISIRGDVSSQYISALMMVAPVLPNGIVLTLQGKIGSRPYIDMTASLLKHFGVVTNVRANEISIQHQDFKPAPFTVESDWSAASYWFAFTALADDAEIALPKLLNQSFQGDSAILNLMVELGVESHFENGLLKLTKKKCAQELRWDFTDCPDLAQTVAVVCAARNVTGFFTGLESLRIKETDRIAALQNELRKIGADLIEDDPEHWRLIPSGSLPVSASFNTYKDHRMAMAFAPLATQMHIEIQDPGVVKKSYPNFWNDMTAVGFELQA